MKKASLFVFILMFVLTFSFCLGCSGSSGGDDNDDRDDDTDDDAVDDDTDDDAVGDCADQTNLGTDLNKTMADFTLTDENGDPLSLYELCDHVVLIVSSTGWCPNCGQEARNITSDIYEPYHDQGLEIFYTLFEDAHENPPSQAYLNAYKKLYGLPFHVYADSTGILFQYQDTYPELYVPFNIILDKNMVIKYKMAGYEPNTLRNYIEQLL